MATKLTAAAKSALASVGKQSPPQAQLEQIRKLLAEARDLTIEIEEKEEEQKRRKQRLYELQHVELPDLFQNAGIRTLGLDKSGNLPEYDTELKPYYKAKIPDDPDQAEKAFGLLNKLKLGDLIKTQVIANLGLRESKRVKQLEAALKKLKIGYVSKKSVPWNTLTAEVRRRHESGSPFDPAQLTTLGADVGRIVTLKKRKAD